MAKRRNNLKPIRQGDFDGLCGVYAIMNGVRCVTGAKWDFHAAYKTGCQVFATMVGDGKPYGIAHVLDGGDVHTVAGALECLKKSRFGKKFAWRKAFPNSGEHATVTLDDLLKLLDDPNSVLLVGYSGSSEHWTIMEGRSPGYVWLIDSYSAESLPTDKIRVTTEQVELYSTEDFVVSPMDVFIIEGVSYESVRNATRRAARLAGAVEQAPNVDAVHVGGVQEAVR